LSGSTFDPLNTLIETIKPARNAGGLFFEQPETRFDFAHVLFEAPNIASDGAKVFVNEIGLVVRHRKKIGLDP
jgi:hypothetical protein